MSRSDVSGGRPATGRADVQEVGTPARLLLLEILAADAALTARELGNRTLLPEDTVRRGLVTLDRSGLMRVVAEGDGPRRYAETRQRD